MKQVFLSCLCLMMLVSTAEAQRYNTAVGLRLSKGVGLTIQQRIASQWTIEGTAFTNFGGNTDYAFTGQYHGKIIFQKRLNWYVGAGFHTGSFDDGNTNGLALIGGLEFSIKRLCLSIDYMPLFNFTEAGSWYEATPAISARYILFKRPKKTLKDRLKRSKKKKKKKRNIF